MKRTLWIGILMALSAWPLLGQVPGRGAATSRYQDPSGYFSFDMPAGWSVAGRNQQGILINPGLRPGTLPEAVIALMYGRLPPHQANLQAAALIKANAAVMAGFLRQQGILVQPSGKEPTTMMIASGPCATVMWPATAGGRMGQVLIGVVVRNGFYLSLVGALAADVTGRYIPGLNQILTTLSGTTPKRNPAAEAALAGRRCANSTYTKSGTAFYAVYQFHPGNRVVKNLSSSGTLGKYDVGSSNDIPGTYEVYGQILYMKFRDDQETGTLLTQGTAVTGFTIGSARYMMY